MWLVRQKKSVLKSIQKLPVVVLDTLDFLIGELENDGPYRHGWPNYGKLGGEKYHCHLKKGKPTYVACWEILDKNSKIMEVYYVGTHEKAPY